VLRGSKKATEERKGRKGKIILPAIILPKIRG
jgi:hypothetical protein